MISVPGHGKDIVDGIHACDKRYTKRKILMFEALEVDECSKRMMAHSMIGNAHYSVAEKCKRLCPCIVIENGTKGYSKYKKHEGEKFKGKLLLYTK